MPGSDPTTRDIQTALSVVAYQHENGWRFHGGTWHTDQAARAITRACLILGVPVSDKVSPTAFAALVDRVAAIEAGYANRSRRTS